MMAYAGRNRKAGFTLITMLVAIGVIAILLGIGSQGYRLAKERSEIVALTGRANQFSTALQLYYQNNRAFPNAYPADLQSDLAPYIKSPDFFVVPANSDAGAEAVNRAYVAPVENDLDRYVLSFDSAYDDSRAVVLYANAVVETVEKLPVSVGTDQIRAGGSLTGSSIAFNDGSRVELSDGTSVTLVQSFVANDGTPIHVVKYSGTQIGSLTAIAAEGAVVEIAAQPALVFLRDGVADVQFLPLEGTGRVKVSSRGGEVLVDGKTVADGQLVDSVVEDRSNASTSFAIDEEHNLVATSDCIATIKVLGKAITYGAGGPACAVQVGANIARAGWQWLFSGNQVYGGEQYQRQITAGTTIAVKGRASYGSWAREYESTRDHRQVLVLLRGDTPPQFAPFDNQPEIRTFCQSVIDGATGRINIESHQALLLFELGTTNMQSPAADFQDLVLLVDFAEITRGGSGEPGTNLPANGHYALVNAGNLITVHEDCSLGVRVLGTSLKKANGQDVSISLKIRVNDNWSNINGGQKVKAGDLYRQLISAGSTIALQARSYNGNNSASYHSADGTGHVLTVLKGEVPDRFASSPPPFFKNYMAKVMDSGTRTATVGANQVLLMYELGYEDASNPSAGFQDIVLVLTFTPQELHNANANNGFDGYNSSGSMGTAADAFAAQNNSAWPVVRESAGPPEGQGNPNAQRIGGMINLNPNNNSNFEFYLQKPTGETITRDDLHASNRQLEYVGGARLIRFKPKGNGNQNSMILNGEPYPLQNGRLYTIVDETMTLHLFNDQKNGDGRSMGHWWISNLVANNAILVRGSLDDGWTPEYSEPEPPSEGMGTVTDSGSRRGGRSLGRGSLVAKGRWIKAERHR